MPDQNPWLLQSQSRNLCADALQAGGDVRNSDKTTRYAAAIACSSCHDLIDGRVKTSDYTKEELRLMHAEGVFRTQEIWRKKGHL